MKGFQVLIHSLRRTYNPNGLGWMPWVGLDLISGSGWRRREGGRGPAADQKQQQQQGGSSSHCSELMQQQNVTDGSQLGEDESVSSSLSLVKRNCQKKLFADQL